MAEGKKLKDDVESDLQPFGILNFTWLIETVKLSFGYIVERQTKFQLITKIILLLLFQNNPYTNHTKNHDLNFELS